MGIQIKVLELDECNLCPYKDLEIYTDANYFYANNQVYDLHKLPYIRCKNYNSCKWLKNKLVGSN